MGKGGAAIGGTFGSLIGLLIGMFIPSESDIAASFFTRITGNAILQDPTGFIISGAYTLVAMAICGVFGTLIGSIFE